MEAKAAVESRCLLTPYMIGREYLMVNGVEPVGMEAVSLPAEFWDDGIRVSIKNAGRCVVFIEFPAKDLELSLDDFSLKHIRRSA